MKKFEFPASPGYFSAHIKSAKIEVIIEQLVDALSDCDAKLKRLEKAKDVHSSPEQIVSRDICFEFIPLFDIIM